MNLVAKEFVAARDDEDGVLVLSKFTGAAVELRDALIVNPYDIAGVAEAMHRGLEMARDERRVRMQQMRKQVMEHNIYRWAAIVLGIRCDGFALKTALRRRPRGDPSPSRVAGSDATANWPEARVSP